MSTGLSAAERVAWLRLARTETVGPVAFGHLIRRYGSAAKALEALPGMAARGGPGRTLRIPSQAEAVAELESGETLGARLLCAGEADFPKRLAALDPAPPLIWARGRAELL